MVRSVRDGRENVIILSVPAERNEVKIFCLRHGIRGFNNNISHRKKEGVIKLVKTVYLPLIEMARSSVRR